MRDRIVYLISLFVLSWFVLASVSWGQQQPSSNNAQPGAPQNMPGRTMKGRTVKSNKRCGHAWQIPPEIQLY
jgi:hypothetical protein